MLELELDRTAEEVTVAYAAYGLRGLIASVANTPAISGGSARRAELADRDGLLGRIFGIGRVCDLPST